MIKNNQIKIIKNVIREYLIDCLIIPGGLWDRYGDHDSNIIEPLKLYSQLLKLWGGAGKIYQKSDWVFDLDEAYDHFQQTGYELLEDEYNIFLDEDEDEIYIRDLIKETWKDIMGE